MIHSEKHLPPDNNQANSGAFAALGQSIFAVLWLATVLGNTGTFIRDVASSWLVTDLSSAPAAVATIQAAGTLPFFLLAVPAGVLSDIFDRRKLLIGVQILLACVSLTLLTLASLKLLTIEALIGLTFIGGVGAALAAPAWQAIVPELVPRELMKSAVGLNSLGINIARAVGPALGGVLLAGFGAAITYGADVASYVLVIAALLWWKRPVGPADVLKENFTGAFRAGLRYARASHDLHIVLLRAIVFFAFASAVWALLPLVARNLLAGSAGYYGFLLGAIGFGAIGGAFLLPTLRARMDANGLLLLSAIMTAFVMVILAFKPPQWLAPLALLLLGLGWIIALTTLNGVAQSILPNWVRGRALAIYLTVFNGAMAGGSLGWGVIAEAAGIQQTLLISAFGLLVAGLAMHRVKLPKGEADLLPSNHWPEPLLAASVTHDRGPVLITVEYRIDPQQRDAFLHALSRLAHERQRDGAYNWGITEDSSDPSVLLEWFFVESWAEHLRQHKRVSKADADLQASAVAFHKGETNPVVRHFIALEPPQGRRSKSAFQA